MSENQTPSSENSSASTTDTAKPADTNAAQKAPTKKTTAKKAPVKKAATKKAPAKKTAAKKKAPAKKTTAKKAPAKKAVTPRSVSKAQNLKTKSQQSYKEAREKLEDFLSDTTKKLRAYEKDLRGRSEKLLNTKRAEQAIKDLKQDYDDARKHYQKTVKDFRAIAKAQENLLKLAYEEEKKVAQKLMGEQKKILKDLKKTATKKK